MAEERAVGGRKWQTGCYGRNTIMLQNSNFADFFSNKYWSVIHEYLKEIFSSVFPLAQIFQLFLSSHVNPQNAIMNAKRQ